MSPSLVSCFAKLKLARCRNVCTVVPNGRRTRGFSVARSNNCVRSPSCQKCHSLKCAAEKKRIDATVSAQCVNTLKNLRAVSCLFEALGTSTLVAGVAGLHTMSGLFKEDFVGRLAGRVLVLTTRVPAHPLTTASGRSTWRGT